MNDLDMKDLTFKFKDALVYVLGALFTAFGVVMLLKSDLGVTSWDVLHTALYTVTPLTFGLALLLVSALITSFIIFYRKDFRYLFLVVPFIIVGIFIDIFNEIVFVDFAPNGGIQIFVFMLGLLIIPLGGTMLIISRYPAGIYDELMLVLMKLFKTRNIAVIRFFMELTPVLLGVSLTFLFKQTIGELYFGTPITVIMMGPLLQLYIKIYRRLKDGNQ